MEDRIFIDGSWYVKEDSVDLNMPIVYFNEDQVSEYQGMHYETNHYAFEAERYITFYGGLPSTISITFTDKRFYPFKEEIWDSETWLIDILDNDPKALEELRNSVCSRGESEFKEFLKYLRSKEWI